MYVIMALRTTIYIDEKLLERFDEHIGLVKRSTAISELMKNEMGSGGGIIG